MSARQQKFTATFPRSLKRILIEIRYGMSEPALSQVFFITLTL